MQNLPVIFSIFTAAAAIIAVLLWRIKPQAGVDLEPLNRRIAEESQKVQTLETALRGAESAAAAAKATMDAATSKASDVEKRLETARAECNDLQARLNQAQPTVATAVAEREAADKAKAELSGRYEALLKKAGDLERMYSQAVERASLAEKTAASAQATAAASTSRADTAEKELEYAKGEFNALQIKMNEVRPIAAKANAEKEAAEEAKRETEGRLQEISRKYDLLVAEYTSSVEQASTSKADVEHLRTQMSDMGFTIERLQSSLTEERAKLNTALAHQQSNEDAVRQFENISQTVLKEVLDEAKRGVGELAAAFQKTSGAELEKHADKITRTLEPLQAQLIAYDAAVESLKKGTQENYGSLREQLNELQKTERSLHDQAKALTTALSASPKVKGTYGEMILKQLVEFVGMQEKCHFETQASRETEEGRKIPDLVVALPGGQKVLVDSKAVMDACVEAQRTQDDVQRAILLKNHCENVRSRIVDLSSKNYFVDHQDAVEAVVLFLPAENLYATAMENDPGLTEYAMGKNIILCGPNSLMLLLKVSNQLWRRAAVEKEVKDIRDCGEKIYKAACDFVEKFAGVGRKIQSLETEYNSAVGTFEGRLLPAGRRMSGFDSVAGSKEIGEIEPIKDNVREFKEATRQLAAVTEKLPGLSLGESETAKFTFSGGEHQ